MRRSKVKSNGKGSKLTTLTAQEVADVVARMNFGARLGWQYGDDRKLYDALGYPTEAQLTFQYYYGKYDRQEIATAIINRPVNKTWDGNLEIVEEKTLVKDSELNKVWKELDKKLKVKKTLTKLDKLAGIGRYSILLFGFSDVSNREGYKTPAIGKKKLLYLKQLSEAEVSVHTWDRNTSHARYGQPLTYKVQLGAAGEETKFSDLVVHHTRVLHILDNNLLSLVYGTPRLKPIVNRLADLEKLFGGSAEMYWRGARPGYHASAKEGFEMSKAQEEALEGELDKWENDLRRFLNTQGVDITALEQQIADPLNHIDAQLQAISTQTEIPKRILIGSERGELSSAQDREQWLSLIQTRMTEFAEPIIFRPFIDKCMSHSILPSVETYNVLWEDVFAPSEADKVKVGKERAETVKMYADSLRADEIVPPELFRKYFLGFTEEQLEEIAEAAKEMIREEDEEVIEEVVE